MAHTIRLVNGPETINLNGSSAGRTWVLDYVPSTPNLSVIDFSPEALRDGGERVSTTRRNVTESMEISLGGSNRDAIITSLNQIEAMFRRAEEHQARGTGSPTYLEIQPDQAASMYRSEILGGRIQPGNQTFSYEWRNNRVTTTIFLARRYYWEGPEIELPLWTTTQTSPGVGGASIYNFNDEASASTLIQSEIAKANVLGGSLSWGGCSLKAAVANTFELTWTGSYLNGGFFNPVSTTYFFAKESAGTLYGGQLFGASNNNMGTFNSTTGSWLLAPPASCLPRDNSDIYANYQVVTSSPAHANWVQVSGSNVIGAIPAPIRLELTNIYNSTRRGYGLRVGVNAFSMPASALFSLEAENATYNVSSSRVTSIGYYSTGSAVAFAAPAASTRAVRWVITGCALDSYQGQYFQILGRTILPSPNTYAKLQLMYPSTAPTTLLSETREIPLFNPIAPWADVAYWDFGILRLPPWVPGASGYGPISLNMVVRTSTGASAQVMFDCLHLLPTDSWRQYEPAGYGLSYNTRLVDDGIRNILYLDSGGPTGIVGYYTAYGGPHQVWPGRDHRFFFLWANDTGDTEIQRTSKVRIYYRPRKLTL